MRQCPHCQAQIQEQAQFCLYCMTPLIEKEEITTGKSKSAKAFYGILFFLVVLVAVGAVVIGLLFGGDPSGDGLLLQGATDQTTSGIGQMQSTQSGISGTAQTEIAPSGSGTQLPQAQFPLGNTTQTTNTPGNTNLYPTTTNPLTTNPMATTPTPTNPKPTTPAVTTPGTTTPTATTPAATTPATTTPATTVPIPPETTAPAFYDPGNGIPGTDGYRIRIYWYSDPDWDEDLCIVPIGGNPDFWYSLATPAIMNDPNYVNPGNEYYPYMQGNFSRTGICHFPEICTDSGGKVVALGPGLGDLVSVYLPKTIVYIGKNTFAKNNSHSPYQSELAYVHIRSDVIDIHANAFPPMSQRMYTVVLRTSAQCRNSAGEYYKDIAGRYGCVWEEWNG